LALQAQDAALLTTCCPAAPAAAFPPTLTTCPAVLFETADLNADVRDTATDYRDPAIAVPQDKVAGGCATSGVFELDVEHRGVTLLVEL
jgi:hypothetical protein